MIEFGFHPDSVWLLFLLLLMPVVWLPRLRRRRAVLKFSSVDHAREAGTSWVARVSWLPLALRTLGVAALVVCIARPIKANERSRISVEGVAIQSVIDRSGSMAAMDFVIEGTRVDRLTAVKKVLADFVEGGDDLPGRPDDLVGLVAFAKYADTVSPLTLDHPHVINALNAVHIATDRSEDGTAIGDAVALAVERLRELEERGDEAGRKIKSKVIVLLTDGENNAGDIDPETAAEIAAAFGVKIYTIGVGSNGAAPIQMRDALGRLVTRRVAVSIDEETLRTIAAMTDGEYFRATDTDSLRAIYEAIDTLEKTTTEQRRYTLYSDLAVQSIRVGSLHVPPLLLIAFLLLATEQLLLHTRFRTLP